MTDERLSVHARPHLEGTPLCHHAIHPLKIQTCILRGRLTGLQPTTDFKRRIVLSVPPSHLLPHINYALGVGSFS